MNKQREGPAGDERGPDNHCDRENLNSITEINEQTKTSVRPDDSVSQSVEGGPLLDQLSAFRPHLSFTDGATNDTRRIATSVAPAGANEAGCRPTEATVGRVALEPPKPPLAERFRPFRRTAESAAATLPRRWLAPRRLIRGKITLLVAPGATGKSLLTLEWAVALALGSGEFCGLEVRERCKVAVINLEDEHDELDMRLDAIFQHFKLPWAEAHDRIHLLSGVEEPFITVKRQSGKLEESGAVDELIKYIRAHNIDVLILDPLVESHEADENNNTEMSRVMRAWKRVASITGAAVLIVHHSRKPTNADLEGSAGRADVGRGASAVPNAARIALTLFNMTPADAKACGVAADARHLYVRLDDAKMNLGLASSRAEWFERKTVRLANGEELGVLAPAGFAVDERRTALRLLVDAQIADAKTKGKRFSASPNATNPAAAAPYPPAAWRTTYPELFKTLTTPVFRQRKAPGSLQFENHSNIWSLVGTDRELANWRKQPERYRFQIGALHITK